ncbi:uncharacterized protein NPIL_120381, partial [Nephila pilipes]
LGSGKGFAQSIKNEEGTIQKHDIPFDTTLIREKNVNVPRLMELYYKPEDVSSCSIPDENPLNDCKPYECDIRYDGARNYYDFKNKKCQKLPSCLPNAKQADPSGVLDLKVAVPAWVTINFPGVQKLQILPKVHQMVLHDHRIKVREIEQTIKMRKERVCHILNQYLGMTESYPGIGPG